MTLLHVYGSLGTLCDRSKNAFAKSLVVFGIRVPEFLVLKNLIIGDSEFGLNENLMALFSRYCRRAKMHVLG
jgi:hypothetical protein